MKDIIKKIHKSDIFGVFIESGCGLAVSQELFSVSESSKTIYFTQSPYSRDFFESEYSLNDKKIRSVSPEYLKNILDSKKIKDLFDKKTINTLYASSFQIGEKNNISTHGWILIKYNEIVKYYHISIHSSLSRKKYIKKIGENGIKLLHAKNQSIPDSCDVDIVLNEDFSYDRETTLKFISSLNEHEQFTVFYKDKIDRIESLTRDTESLIIFKGSFNPIQKAHEYIINRSMEKYKGKFVFMISLNVFQKGKQNIDSILNRINLINELDFPVIVCNKPFFRENISFIRNKFEKNKKIILLMGVDTFNRLMNDYYFESKYNLDNYKKDFENVEILCFDRDKSEIDSFLKDKTEFFSFEDTNYREVSSTKIRDFLKNNQLEEIKEIVPAKIYDIILEKNGIKSN